MRYDVLNSQLKKGQLSNIYLFTGEENFVKERSLRRLIDVAITGIEEFNVTIFDEDAMEEEITAAIEQLPLMSAYRVVIVKDCPALKSTGSDMKHLTEKIDEIPSTTILVFYMRDRADGKRTLSKKLKPYSVEFPHLNRSEISAFLCAYAKQNSIGFPQRAIDLLVDQVGEDSMETLVLETEKLFSIVDKGKSIEVETIKKYATKNVEAKAFEMIDAVLNSKMEKIEEQSEAILAEGSIFSVIGAFSYRLRSLMEAQELQEQGLSFAQAQSKMSGPAFAKNTTWQQAKKLSPKGAQRALLAFSEAEYGRKNGKFNDKQCLYAVIGGIRRELKK